MGIKPSSPTEALLIELGGYGYCLRPTEQALLVDRSFENATEFIDAFLVAYGLQPVLVDRRRYRQLLAVAEKWISADSTVA